MTQDAPEDRMVRSNDVFDVVAVLEDHIAGYNKELWFLKSMMA